MNLAQKEVPSVTTPSTQKTKMAPTVRNTTNTNSTTATAGEPTLDSTVTDSNVCEIAPPDSEVTCPNESTSTKPPAKKRQRKTKEVESTPTPKTITDEEKGVENNIVSTLIVAKAVRLHLKEMDTVMHCGADSLPALNAKIKEIIDLGAARARANGRRTVKAADF